jgi:hypothetical protein
MAYEPARLIAQGIELIGIGIICIAIAMVVVAIINRR